MPLSEYEQRVLDQLERDLGADPSLARAAASASQPRSRGRLVLGVFGVVLGLVILVGGVASKTELLGILGFAVMAGAVLFTVLAPTKSAQSTKPSRPDSGGPGRSGSTKNSSSKGAASNKAFMDRLEERFDRRRREGDI